MLLPTEVSFARFPPGHWTGDDANLPFALSDQVLYSLFGAIPVIDRDYRNSGRDSMLRKNERGKMVKTAGLDPVRLFPTSGIAQMMPSTRREIRLSKICS